MKAFTYLFLVLVSTFCASVFAQEVSHKEGFKTGAETVVNGTALIGILGATSSQQTNRDNQRHPKTWNDLGAMHRSRPSEAEFGK
jgi:hypothetical protein